MFETSGRGVPIHPEAEGVAQDRSVGAVADSAVDRSGHGWRQWDEHDFADLATDAQHAVAVLLAQVVDAGRAGLEDPQPEQAEHCEEGEVVRVCRQSGGGDQCFELKMTDAESR
jgi:hypothetical protein